MHCLLRQTGLSISWVCSKSMNVWKGTVRWQKIVVMITPVAFSSIGYKTYIIFAVMWVLFVVEPFLPYPRSILFLALRTEYTTPFPTLFALSYINAFRQTNTFIPISSLSNNYTRFLDWLLVLSNAFIFPMVYLFYPETSGRSLEEMDIIFRKCHSYLDVVQIARDEPHRFGRKGELLINYQETAEYGRRRSSIAYAWVRNRKYRYTRLEHKGRQRVFSMRQRETQPFSMSYEWVRSHSRFKWNQFYGSFESWKISLVSTLDSMKIEWPNILMLPIRWQKFKDSKLSLIICLWSGLFHFAVDFWSRWYTHVTEMKGTYVGSSQPLWLCVWLMFCGWIDLMGGIGKTRENSRALPGPRRVFPVTGIAHSLIHAFSSFLTHSQGRSWNRHIVYDRTGTDASEASHSCIIRLNWLENGSDPECGIAAPQDAVWPT